MKIDIYNTHAVFTLQDSETPMCMLDLSKYFRQNDHLRKFRMVFRAQHGRLPQLTQEEDMMEFILFVDSPYYQNYLCKKYAEKFRPGQKSNHNFVLNTRFSDEEMWDGYTRILRHRGRSVEAPIGYLRPIMRRMYQYFKDNNLPLSFEPHDHRINLVHTEVTPEPVYEVAGMTLRDHQREVVDLVRGTLLNTKKNGHLFSTYLMDLAVNFGKTLTISAILKNFPFCSAISWQADQTLFFKQIEAWVEAGFDVGFVGNSALTETKVNKHLASKGIEGVAHKGFRKHTVAMVQTVYSRIKNKKMMGEYVTELQKFQIAIFDEVDWLVRPTFDDILKHCRFGLHIALSGTPNSSFNAVDRHRVKSLAGGNTIRKTHAEMVDLGISLPLEYRVIPMQKKAFLEFGHITNKYIREQYIFFSQEWQDKVSRILDKHKGSQIMIYMGAMEIAYMEQVYTELKSRGFDIGITHGQDKERVQKQIDFEKGEGPTVMLVNSIWGTGINIPNLEVFIYASLSDSEREFIQATTGRIARIGDLQKGYVYDFHYVDFGPYTINSLVRQHYASRSDINLEVVNPFIL